MSISSSSARLDHLVYATPDLAATTADIASRLGVAPVVGGRHVGRGTANTLLALGDSVYLEIVGPDISQPDPPFPRPFGVDGLVAARLVAFAVRVTSMAAAIAAARADGYDPGEGAAMQRATPDGALLSWTLTEAPAWAGGAVPFLIDWQNSQHPSRTIGAIAALREFIIASPDHERVAQAISALGMEMAVERSDEPLLTAVVDGPTGSVTLSSAAGHGTTFHPEGQDRV